MVLNFLRFRQRPPGKTPPPNNRVDVFHDAETGKLVARDSQGNPVLFDSAAGGATWGAITGSLASQDDLTTALALKAPLISPSFTTPSLGVATVATVNSLTLNTTGGVISNAAGVLLISWDGVGTSEGAAQIKGYVRTSIGGSIDTEGTGTINLGSNGTRTVLTGSATANRTVAIPDVSGAAGVLRQYADSTAANAAVSVGDAWWDTTLKKARVRLT